MNGEEKFKMSIKIALLKSGETIISDAKEIITEDNHVKGYLFNKPHKVSMEQPLLLLENEETEVENSINVGLSPWIVLTDDEEIFVRPDWVVTLVEPLLNLKDLYEEKVNGKNGKVSFTEE